MLERESFGTGWQVSLRPKGVSRFVTVAFLGAWLCGWAAGEFFAGGTLLAGLRDLLAPDLDVPWLPHMMNRAPSNPWPILAFLGFWLTGWTAGGLFAMTAVARALVGVDHVRWDHEGVEVVRQAGPFSSRRRLAWGDAHELFTQRRGQVVAHTRRGLVRISGFGTDDDRRELGEWLCAAWRDSRGSDAERLATTEQSPAGWTVETAEDGRPMLASDRRPRRLGAILAGAVALGLSIAGASIAGRGAGGAAWVGAGVFGAFALLAGSGAAWLALGRVELRPAPGSLRRVKRFPGREWARELSPARLALRRSRDSDGDERWELVASGPDSKLTLASDLHVPGAARHLGLWLARRMAVELEGLPEAGGEQRRAG